MNMKMYLIRRIGYAFNKKYNDSTLCTDDDFKRIYKIKTIKELFEIYNRVKKYIYQ